jgi:hypothetical protein
MNSQDVLFYGDNRKLREEAGWKEARCLDDITHHEGFVINWGKWIPESVRLYPYNTSTGHRINFYSSSNKEKELLILEAAGIRVPKVIDMVHIRTTNHHGGGDFDPNRSGVFVTEHIDTIMEYRLHVVGEWAILGGSKHPLVPNPHPFVRSYKKGWGIEYDQSSFVRDRCREIGVASIKALGLDFGAVDIGEKENGDLVVWEVNRKPGLFPLARTRYIKSLNRLIEERS